MISHLQHKNIDKKLWDRHLEQCVNPLIYARSWYLDIVSPGWSALVKGDFEALMPLPVKKKLLCNMLLQPTLTQQLGIFYKPNIKVREADFLSNIPHRFKYIVLGLNEWNLDVSRDFLISRKKNHILSLNQPYETLRKNYSNHHKRALRKGKNFDITTDIDIAEFIDFGIETLFKRIDNFNRKQQATLEELMEAVLAQKKGFIIGNKDKNGQLLAAIFYLEDFGRLTYLISLAGEKARQHNLMTKLIDHTIKVNSEKPLTLDFEGSSISSIARFFKGFGAEAVNYPEIKKNDLPWLLKTIIR